MEALAIINALAAPAGAIGSGLVGWYSKVVYDRAQTRKDALNAGQQALTLLDQASGRDRLFNELLSSTMERLKRLLHLRWQMDDLLADVYAQAISARMLVHELDAKAGRPPRVFVPLPAYPSPASDEPAEQEKQKDTPLQPDAATVAGDRLR